MPPKKQKVKAIPEASATELGLQDKFMKATLEIDSLQRELEMKNDIVSRLRTSLKEQSARVLDLETLLEIRAQDRLDLTSDMSRQYKTMQLELVAKVTHLTQELGDYRHRLAQTMKGSQDAEKEFEKQESIKDSIIEEQNIKMAYMNSEFEGMLNDTLTKMTKKLEAVTQKWKDTDNQVISESNMRRLEDFNLTRVALGDLS